MKNRFRLTILISFALLYSIGAYSQVSLYSSKTEEIAKDWLLLACIDGEEKSNQSMIANHPELEPYFINIIQNGIDKSLLDEERNGNAQLYDNNMKTLNESKPEWVTKEYEAMIRSVSKEEFIESNVSAFIANYKDRAIKGLEIINEACKLNNIISGINLKTYPNPVINENVNIEYSISTDAKMIKIMIIDNMGKTIIKQEIQDQSIGTYNMNLNTNSLISGNYYCMIEVDGNTLIQKIVVMNNKK